MKPGRKRRRKSRDAGLRGVAQEGFVKGFVSTGMLATLRYGPEPLRVLRQALQGGAALATASAAAAALHRGSPAALLASLVLGAAGLYLIGPWPGPGQQASGDTEVTD